jgi:arsenite methyltransferase
MDGGGRSFRNANHAVVVARQISLGQTKLESPSWTGDASLGPRENRKLFDMPEAATPPVGDRWSQWLLGGREGGDQALRQRFLTEILLPVRDQVLERGRIEKGEVVLDVGAGDGLIAFGALDRVGPTGRVIFSDVSADVLQKCRSLATELNLTDRCSFVECSADNLTGVADMSVDVVTTRSVLIYVDDKRKAFEEFHRVLRPRGRISIWEPINSLTYPEPANEWFGYDVSPVRDLVARIKSAHLILTGNLHAMMGFDERDLFNLAGDVGFVELHLELRRRAAQRPTPRSWDSFCSSSPNPLSPTFAEVIERALSAEEARRFTAHLRPLVEEGRQIERLALAHLWAERLGA